MSPGAIQRKNYEKLEILINIKNRQTLLLFVGGGAIFITPTVVFILLYFFHWESHILA
jgi:F0F1-type ATP synthase assembly protein I